MMKGKGGKPQELPSRFLGIFITNFVLSQLPSTSKDPLCCFSTIPTAMLRPSPWPSPNSFVVKKGSKILSLFSKGIPSPESVIEKINS